MNIALIGDDYSTKGAVTQLSKVGYGALLVSNYADLEIFLQQNALLKSLDLLLVGKKLFGNGVSAYEVACTHSIKKVPKAIIDPDFYRDEDGKSYAYDSDMTDSKQQMLFRRMLTVISPHKKKHEIGSLITEGHNIFVDKDGNASPVTFELIEKATTESNFGMELQLNWKALVDAVIAFSHQTRWPYGKVLTV